MLPITGSESGLPSSERSRIRRSIVVLGLFCSLVLVVPGIVLAEVERMEVKTREVLADGQTFGAFGVYEAWRGTLHFAIDPRHSSNRAIIDLRLAPRSADGKVRFHSDFMLVQPREPKHRGGTVLLEVPNRGRRTLQETFHTPGRPPREASWTEAPLLLERGFRLLWVGWQGDTPYDPELLSLQKIDIVVDDEGLLRSDHVFTEPASVMPLAHRNHRPYGVSRPNDPRNQLTVRVGASDRRQIIPRSRWRFARLDSSGRRVKDPFWIHLDGGFEAGKIYEVVYVANRSWVAGLGLAAVRDAASYFKYEGRGASADHGASGSGAVPPPKARILAFGSSQGGRFLRQVIYQGFARDASGREVFDGVWIHAAGAGRGSFNHRFAEPSREAHAFAGFDYPIDLPPFHDLVEAGASETVGEGFYDRWRGRSSHLPAKVIYTHTSYEYWSRGASLTHTTSDGATDIPLDANERVYFLAGSQHVVDGWPPRGVGTRHGVNPLDYRFAMRGLLVAIDDWLRGAASPPASRYPKLADGSLVDPEKLRWPAFSEVERPRRWLRPRRLDFGPRFRGQGLVDHQPPKVGKAYPVKVPQVGDDGNELAGIRLPQVAVPVATFSGWNQRADKLEARDELAILRGAAFPLPRTAEVGHAGKDSRPSLEELYGDRAEFLKRYEAAAGGLARERYVLPEDLPALRSRGAELWDWAAGRAGR